MQKIFKRVADWNSLRYERKFDLALSVDLLREEHKEWLTAILHVDSLDALCDVIYVAMGVIWKCNIDENSMNNAQYTANKTLDRIIKANEPNPAYFTGMFLDVFEHDNEMPVVLSMMQIIQASMAQVLAMGLSYDQFLLALNIVCDANDTKVAHKTPNHLKANLYKGENFVAPEARLQELLNQRKDFH